MYAQGMETREIAKVVFSTDTPTQANLAYVRVAGRQRTESGLSPHDRNWRIKKFGSMKAYHDHQNAKSQEYRNTYYRDRYNNDPAYRAAKSEYARNWYQKKKLSESRESA